MLAEPRPLLKHHIQCQGPYLGGARQLIQQSNSQKSSLADMCRRESIPVTCRNTAPSTASSWRWASKRPRCCCKSSGDAPANLASNQAIDEAGELLHEAVIPAGRLEVRPLQLADIQAACVVMTKAFGTTDENITLTGAMAYIKGLLGQGTKGTFLVARLFPTDKSLLAPNQDSRIVGTVALSFHPDTMQPCPTLPPPPGVCYLSNMAVDAKLRRQGIARALLTAAATATLKAGQSSVYLHVKQSDPAPQQLYASSGYVELARDSVLVKLKGIKPRVLMMRKLT